MPFYRTYKIYRPRLSQARAILYSILVLCLLAGGLAGASPSEAAFDFPLTETFMTASAPGWVLGGTPNRAILTSGGADPAGNGWLRLTNANASQAGYAYYNEPIPTGRGLVITFDYAAWGGTGADGLTFFLFDGATTAFNVGASGGSLGYAQRTGVNGLSNGYLGLGLDEFGNYSNPTEGRVGGPGFVPEAVAVRGPGNRTSNYNYLAGTSDLTKAPWSLPKLDCPRNYGSCGNGAARPASSYYYRQARITVTPVGAAYQVTVEMKFSAAGAWRTLFGPFTMPTAAPGTLKMGFSASTGGSTNYHEIRNLSVTQKVPDVTASKAVENATTGGGSVAPGDELLYTVVLKNNTTAAISGVRFTDAIPANTTYVAGSAILPTGASLNAVSPALDIANITIPASGQEVITFKVKVDAALPSGVTQISNQGTFTYGAGPTTAQTDGDAVADGSQATIIAVTAGPNFDTSTKTVELDDRDHNSAVSPGDILTYHVILKNTGNQNSTAIAFSDVIPANTSYVNGSAVTSRGTASYNSASKTLTWSVSIDAGDHASLDFRVTVNSGVQQRTVISNQGSLVYGSPVVTVLTDADLATPGKQPTQVLVGGVATLTATKTASVISPPLQPGGVVEYTVDLANTSSYAVSGATFTDSLPANTTYVPGSVSASSGVASFSGSAINVTGINLAAGAHATIAFRVQLNDPLPPGVTQIANQGVVSWDSNQSGANNTSLQTDGDPASAGQQRTITAIPNVDLALTKTVDRADPAEGAPVAYTLRVVNNGPASAANVTVTDALPAGLTYSGSSATQGSYTSPTWAVGTLASGASATLTISADVDLGQGGTTLSNSAVAASNLYDAHPADNTASVDLSVRITSLTGAVTDRDNGAPLANVELQITGGCTAVTDAAGVYTVVSGVDGCLLAAGPANVTVVDAPDGYLPTTAVASIAAGQANTQNLALVRPSLSGVVTDLGPGVPLVGATVTLTQGVTTCTAVTGDGGAYAFVAGSGSPACNFTAGAAGVSAAYTGYQSASASPDILSTGPTIQNLALGTVDLLITKSDGQTIAQPGETLNYVITVVNNGSIDAASVTLTDRLSNYLTYISDDSGVTPANPSLNEYQYALGDLPVGASVSFTLTARAASVLPDGATALSNYAVVSTPTAEKDRTNNEVSDVNTVETHPDLSLFKTFSSASPAVSLSTVTYVLSGANNGFAVATGGMIVDQLDPLTTYAAGSAALTVNGSPVTLNLTYDLGAGVLSVELPDLAPGDRFVLTFAATVAELPEPSPALHNQAFIYLDQTDLNYEDNEAGLYVPTINSADVSVRIWAAPAVAMPGPGDQIVYTLMYANNGSDPANNVLLTAAIPLNTSLVPGSITGGGVESGGVITWDLASLSSRAGGEVTFTVQVDNPLAAGINAIAAGAEISTSTSDSEPSNNNSSVTTFVGGEPDLVIAKTDGETKTLAGNAVTYTITYSNRGSQGASGVTIVDTLLNGVTIDPARLVGDTYQGSNPYSTYDPGAGTLTWTIGDLPVDGPHTITVDLLVKADALPSSVAANRVAILEDGANGVDPNPADNTATDSNTVVAPGLALEKGVSGPALVGQPLTYVITATNTNLATAFDVVITDTLPAGVVLVPASITGGGIYNPIAGAIRWEFGDLAPSAGVTASFAVTPGVSASGAAQTQPGLSVEPGSGRVAVVSRVTPASKPWCDFAQCAAFRGLYQAENGAPPEGWKDNPRLTLFDDSAWTQPVAASTAESFYWTDPSHLSADWATVHTDGELFGNFTFFRQAFCMPLNATGLSAGLDLAGDDVSDIYLNDVYLGQKVGAGAAASFDAGGGIQTGINLLAVQLLNNRHGGHAALGGEDHSGLLFNLNATYSGLRPFVSAPAMIVLGEEVTLAVDENALGGRKPYQYRVDFGDGTVIDYQDQTTLAHTYAAPGVYVATVTARAQYGCTGSDQATITVLEADARLLANPVIAAYSDASARSFTAQGGAGAALGDAADLELAKSVVSGGTIPGQAVTYQLLVTNHGPSAAAGVVISDTLPAALDSASWTCASAGGSCASASGSGDVLNETVTLPAGATASFTIQGVVASGARGPMQNTAEVSPPAGVADPTPGNNRSTVATTLAPDVQMAISKTSTPKPGLAAGRGVVYVIQVSNNGSSDAAPVQVTDSFPVQLTGVHWACTASSGSACAAYGAGDIHDAANLLAGGSLTYTIWATVDPAVQPETEIANTASAVYESTTVTATDANTVAAMTGLTASKDALDGANASSRTQPFIDADGNGGVSPGDTLKYRVVIGAGAADAYALVYTDPLAPATTLVTGSVTCTPACTVVEGNLPGDRAVEVAIDRIGAGAFVVLEYQATVDAALPFAQVSLANQGFISAANAASIATNDLETDEPADATAVRLAKASISGFTWRDDDRDSVRDAGEPLMANLPVALYYKGGDGVWGSADDELVYVLSDANGTYAFTDLLAGGAGLYRVGFSPPAGFSFSPMGAHSRPDPLTGLTGPLTLAAEEARTGVSAGLVSQADFGNLPARYHNTSWAEDGARHVVSPGGLRLGATRQAENDGAEGEPSDNDGVARRSDSGWLPGGTAVLDVTSSGSGRLYAWFDWNDDGDFADAGESVDLGMVAAGTQAKTIVVSAGYVTDRQLYARFRLYPADYVFEFVEYGLVSDGEVEDYHWTFSPTAAVMAGFTAAWQASGGVLIAWETALEIDLAGFNLYRSTSPDRGYVRLNPTLVPSRASGSLAGAKYTWPDPAAQPNVSYYYRLEAVDLDGATSWHGPVWLFAPGSLPVKIYLPALVNR